MNASHEKLMSLVGTSSDINEHLLTLLEYATGCEHITEIGTRNVVSTWAFLNAKPKKLIAIDINDCPVEEISLAAKDIGVDFVFLKQDSIASQFVIEPTDFLFIDSLHTYHQLKEELNRHGNQVRKYIGFHDTVTFGHVNESNIVSNPSGLVPAINEFIAENSHWVICNIYNHNNGLTILRRET